MTHDLVSAHKEGRQIVHRHNITCVRARQMQIAGISYILAFVIQPVIK